MWRKRIFKWQPSKLLWIWIFGAVIKVRTTEKNYYLGRLLWSCLKPQAGFAEREKKLYWRLDCCSEWLHSLYSGYLWFIFFMSDKQAAVIYIYASDSASGFAIMKKQHLSSFVAGQGTLVPCIFMCFSINFQTSSCGFFVCLLFSRWNCISSFKLTHAPSIYGEHGIIGHIRNWLSQSKR